MGPLRYNPGRTVRYYAGRWYVNDQRVLQRGWRWSAPAYVSPGRRPPRVSMRGPMLTHSA
jgi:hypothetical protein